MTQERAGPQGGEVGPALPPIQEAGDPVFGFRAPYLSYPRCVLTVPGEMYRRPRRGDGPAACRMTLRLCDGRHRPAGPGFGTMGATSHRGARTPPSDLRGRGRELWRAASRRRPPLIPLRPARSPGGPGACDGGPAGPGSGASPPRARPGVPGGPGSGSWPGGSG